MLWHVLQARDAWLQSLLNAIPTEDRKYHCGSIKKEWKNFHKQKQKFVILSTAYR